MYCAGHLNKVDMLTKEAFKTDNTNGSKECSSSMSYVSSFFDYTTAHGFGRLLTGSAGWRAYWVLFCLGAYGVFIWECTMLVSSYSEKPIKTRTQLLHSKILPFPVVTICNLNVLRQSKISPSLRSEFEVIVNKSAPPPEKPHVSGNKKERKGLPEPDNLHFDEVKKLLMQNAIANHEQNELEESGHQLEDMVVYCKFNGLDCRDFGHPDSSWTQIWNDHLGNCYMFNTGKSTDGKPVDLYYSTLPGESNGEVKPGGLSLSLNIEQEEYLEDITKAAGLKIFIGDQGRMPFPALQGIRVMPGMSTGIEMTKFHAIRLDPFNNGSCEGTNKLSQKNIFSLYNMSYSKVACKYSCLNDMQLKECGCTQFATPKMRVQSIKPNACSAFNKSVVSCLNGVFEEFTNGDCDKECPNACSDTSFEMTISSSKWPAKSYQKRLLQILEKENNLTMGKNEIADNLGEVHIYFGDLDYFLVEETLSYRFMSLLSDLGGQMGMWIGVSALTCAEVLELFALLIKDLVKKYQNKTIKPTPIVELNAKQKTDSEI